MDSEQFIFADVRRHAILCRWHEKGFEHWDDEGASKDIGIETKQANAHLIAAAPELLALLMKLDRIGGLGLSTHKEIQSVIAKALGQQ
ncbi:hypothetical protein ACWWJK_18200 [Providencia stuartii]